MDSDVKYIILIVGLFIVGVFSAIAYSDHNRYACRMELAKTDRPVAEVELLCK